MNKKHVGSNFDDFLKEEKLDSANILAIKRVIAYQIAEEMKKKKLSKPHEDQPRRVGTSA